MTTCSTYFALATACDRVRVEKGANVHAEVVEACCRCLPSSGMGSPVVYELPLCVLAWVSCLSMWLCGGRKRSRKERKGNARTDSSPELCFSYMKMVGS